MGACSPSSHKDFVQEAEGLCRCLIKDLQLIRHSQDLAGAEAKLQKDFEALSVLILEARKYQLNNPEAFSEQILECPSEEALRLELIRVYAIEGGRQAIEKMQREPLARLDRFERQHKKSNK